MFLELKVLSFKVVRSFISPLIHWPEMARRGTEKAYYEKKSTSLPSEHYSAAEKGFEEHVHDNTEVIKIVVALN